jgi:hypothetical protein
MARALDSTFQTIESDLKAAREGPFPGLGVLSAYPDGRRIGDLADDGGEAE